MEMEEGYLENPEFEKLLERLIDVLKKEMHFGYLFFFQDVIIQVYTVQRKYKKALEFQKEISCKTINSHS